MLLTEVNTTPFAKRLLNNAPVAVEQSIKRQRPLFRGADINNEQQFIISLLDTHLDRPPKDLPQFLHQTMDKAMQEKFGIKGRSQTVFGTGDFSQANTYGYPVMLFPISPYKIIYSTVFDPFYYYEAPDELYDMIGFEPSSENNEQDLKQAFYKLVTETDAYHCVDNITHLPDDVQEVMIDCEQYYIADVSLWNVLNEQHEKQKRKEK